MQKFLHLLCMALAALSLLVMPLLPHHHHDGVACRVVEFCRADHMPNDAHTQHHETGHSHESEGCAEHVQSTAARALRATQVLPAPVCLPADFTPTLARQFTASDEDLPADAYCNTLHPRERAASGGLRAPPHSFS